MELTGLTLTQVLTTFAIVGGAVFVLYLLKLRRRQVAVPFVKLWEHVLAEKQTTRLFSQLKRILSLLIALAIVAILAFALGDPRYAGATASGRSLVVLVDASASMQATDVEPSRLRVALERVRGLVEGLGPADRMLVAQMDATTTPVTPLTDEPRVLLDALDGIEATDVSADLGAGLRFALDVLRNEPGAEIVVVSDGHLPPAEAEAQRLRDAGVLVSFIPIGEGSRNVAITAFAVRRYPLDKSQSEVLVELWNPSENDESVELTLVGDGEPVDVQRLAVKKGERLRRFYGSVSGADRTLEARVALADGTHDQLGVDDHAFARLPERRRARILAVSRGNLYLSAALLLDEYLDVVEVTPEQYPAEGRFDAVVFDNFVPPTPPDTAAIYIHPQPAEGVVGPFEIGGDIDRPFFDRVDRTHPLTRFTALSDVNIARALELRPRDGDRIVGGDRRGPLLIAGTRDGHRMVAFAFNIHESDLALRIAWPLLLLNSIDWFVEEDASYLSSYRTGETWHVPVPAGHDKATIESPAGDEREVPVVEGRAVYAGNHAGFYTVRAGDFEEVFAANLGPGEESDIHPAETLEVGDAPAQEPTSGKAGVRREIWIYLVMLVLAVLAVEWLSYHRRWTV